MRSPSRAFAAVLALTAALAAVPAAAQDDVPEVVRTLLERAERDRAAGRLAEALDGYRRAREIAPQVVAIYLGLGSVHDARGELEPALEAFTAGLGEAPRDTGLLYNAAVVALRLDRAEVALRHVDAALAVGPREARFHTLRGGVLRRLDRLSEALTALETAARLDPGDPQVHYRLGNLEHQLGRADEAIASFQEAIRRDKSFLPAHYNLGAVLFERGRDDEALEAYRMALVPIDKAFAGGSPVDSTHAQAYRNLGAILYRRKDWARSLDAYTKALRLEPDQAAVLYAQGFVLFQLGRLPEAEEAYRRALAKESELPLAYLHLGQIHRRRGELEKAADWLDQGLARVAGEDRLALLHELAATRRELGRDEPARAAYREILAARPDDLAAAIPLARLLRKAGDDAGARTLLEDARRRHPGSTAAALELAALAKARGDRAGEKRLYEELLRAEGGGSWSVEVNLALIQLEEGQEAEARKRLDGVLARTSRGADAPDAASRRVLATTYALLLARQGETGEAQKRLRAVLAEDRAFTPAAAALAVLEGLEGKAGGGLEATAAALEKARGRALEPLYRADLGQLLWLAGRFADAKPHLEAATRDFPAWPSLPAALGDLALRGGDVAAALPHLERAARLCRDAAAPTAASPGQVFAVTLGGHGGALCDRVSRSLGGALASSALAGLDAALRAGAPGRAAEPAERALALPLEPGAAAVARFVRGTARLAGGEDGAARGDLAAAVAGPLPRELQAPARANLGVALYRLGDVAGARTELQAARAALLPAASLNLAILLDEGSDERERALPLYEEYLSRGGTRREQARAWADRLRRVYATGG